jgi:nucleotide-binding universal stress UspA family protein
MNMQHVPSVVATRARRTDHELRAAVTAKEVLMNDQRLRILLPMEPEEEGTDLLRLLEALFPPERVVLRRLYVYRPAQLDFYIPEMYVAMPEVDRMNADAEAAAVAESNRQCEIFRGAGYEIESEVRPGVATTEVLAEAKSWGARLIMIRTSRIVSESDRIGSLTSALMFHSTVPILTYRHVRPGFAVGKLLIPTDLSASAHQAAIWGIALARRLGCEAHLLHVSIPHRWENAHRLGEAAKAEAERWLEQTRPLLESRVDAHIHSSRDIAAGVLEFAAEKRFDMMVMSARGQSAAAAVLLGSNARRIARGSATPLLVIPANNEVDPEEVSTHLSSIGVSQQG